MSSFSKRIGAFRPPKFLTRRVAFVLLAVLAVIIGALSIPMRKGEIALAQMAAKACEDAEPRSHCYEEEIPKFMDNGLSMETMFRIVRELQIIDTGYRDCHVLAHNISSRETAKDPSKWKDVVARSPYGMCGNGASHGAFQERFREESLPSATVEDVLREIEGVCDDRDWWHPSQDERSNCVHGIGHLAMYITGGDVDKSADICTEFAEKLRPNDHRQTCYEGIFMQVFQPLEETDKLLVADITPKYDDRMPFCDTFEGLVRSICVRESWILVPSRIATPEGYSAHCKPLMQSPDDYRYCAEGIGMGVFMVAFQYDVPKMKALCSALEPELGAICITSAARRFIQTDWHNIGKALQVCRGAPVDAQPRCFENLIGYGQNTLKQKPNEASELCTGMPEPWRKKCGEAVEIAI